MEPITIITTAMGLLTPYLIKTGEKISEEVGESLWTWIRKRFSQQGNEHQLPELSDSDFQEKIKKLLLEKIDLDENFKRELEIEIEKKQRKLNYKNLQNIENKGHIGKQINIQENHGNIQM
nr:hypothetical protein [uncultured Bacteroides sp.]